ncbi:MAG: hypothetical protein K0R66_172 [Gammaproteobacteria bacterium]|jgi:hypothetical protein|nr:hypothetical protein [Gammaproteobacteria bacterium]
MMELMAFVPLLWAISHHVDIDSVIDSIGEMKINDFHPKQSHELEDILNPFE